MHGRHVHSSWTAVALVLAILPIVRHCSSQSNELQEMFTEEAVVSPLSDGRVLVHFHFTLTAPSRQHYTLFPLSVGQLAAAVPFDEIELFLTQGRWHYHRWDQPLISLKPAGAELQATFSSKISQSALPALWSSVSHALGGLFCASLHFVARPQSTATQAITAKQSAVQPDGVHRAAWSAVAAESHVLYAVLPQEASCTENLTPWLKLLPCRDAAGLGQLLRQRDVLFGAEYHSLRVSLKVLRGADLQPLYSNLTQTLTLVLDPSSSSSSTAINSFGKTPIQTPKSVRKFDLANLMGSSLQSVCPAAQASRMYVLLPGQVPAAHLQNLLKLPGCPAGQKTDSGSHNSSSTNSQNEQLAAHIGDQDRGNFSNEAQEFDHTARRCCRSEGAFKTQVGLTLNLSPDAAVFAQAVTSRSCVAPSSAATADDEQQISSSGSSNGGRYHLMYMYDLQQTKILFKDSAMNKSSPSASDSGSTARLLHNRPDASLLPLSLYMAQNSRHSGQEWLQRVQPFYTVDRYIIGSGNLHGGMVLELHAPDSSAQEEGNVGVCIVQVVPWYVRLWLHTLQLTLDGKTVPLAQHLLARHISTAQDRARPLVLNLCLRLPATAQHVTLSAKFSKAFLTAFEHPPDAHRGFDVPAAQITFLGPVSTESDVAQSAAGIAADTEAAGAAEKGRGSVGWGVVYSRQQAAAGVEGPVEHTALLQYLTESQPEQVYSPGLVVPLAVPDFSMPYNVICLTSTVLAVFTGATLNALLERPGKEQRLLAQGKEAKKAEQRKKKFKLLLMIIVFVVFGLYVDPTLQDAVVEQLKAAGLVER